MDVFGAVRQRWLWGSGAVLCALFLLVPAWLTFSQEPVATLQSIRVGFEANANGGKTRLVLDLDKDVQYRWFTLPSPPRVVLDFPDIAVGNVLERVALPDGSLVKSLRAGNFRPGTTRMVIDIAKPARLSIFTIPGNTQRGPRVVMDVVSPKPGQAPTDVPPPPDVVTTAAQPRPADQQKAAPVVPRQVVTKGTGPVIVVLDAGHGGVDPGALGKSLREKDITLDMVKRVRDELEGNDIKVLLTRDKDVFVPLPDRVKFAQRNNASLFVSLHADSHPEPDVRGATVYMVSERASDSEAQRLASSENKGDILAGIDISKESPDVQNILIRLVERETINHSSYLAQSVINAINRTAQLRKDEPLFAGFKVLKAPDVPSILIEMGYITNRTEERNLGSSAYRKKLASSIATGIKTYIKKYVR